MCRNGVWSLSWCTPSLAWREGFGRPHSSTYGFSVAPWPQAAKSWSQCFWQHEFTNRAWWISFFVGRRKILANVQYASSSMSQVLVHNMVDPTPKTRVTRQLSEPRLALRCQHRNLSTDHWDAVSARNSTWAGGPADFGTVVLYHCVPSSSCAHAPVPRSTAPTVSNFTFFRRVLCKPSQGSRRARALSLSEQNSKKKKRGQLPQPPHRNGKGWGVCSVLRHGVEQQCLAHSVSPTGALPFQLSDVGRKSACRWHTRCERRHIVSSVFSDAYGGRALELPFVLCEEFTENLVDESVPASRDTPASFSRGSVPKPLRKVILSKRSVYAQFPNWQELHGVLLLSAKRFWPLVVREEHFMTGDGWVWKTI